MTLSKDQRDMLVQARSHLQAKLASLAQECKDTKPPQV